MKKLFLVLVLCLVLVSFVFSLESVNGATASCSCGGSYTASNCAGTLTASNCGTSLGYCACEFDCSTTAYCPYGYDELRSGGFDCFHEGVIYGCSSGSGCSPVNAQCDAASDIDCGTTQTRSGSCNGNSCSVTGTKCPLDQTCVNAGGWKCMNLNETIWLNLVGSNISSAGLGDTVFMMFGGVGVNNQNISYSINKWTSTSTWWNPFSWNDFAWDSMASVSGKVTQPLVLGSFSLDDKIRFNATVVGTVVSGTSSNLTITSVSNSIPNADLTSPTNNAIFANFTLVNFTQASTDEDDLLNITWNFGDGSSLVSYSDYSHYLNSTRADTSHVFNLPGQYTVQLTAKEMTRNQKDNDSVKITILKPGINVVPVITSPLEGQSIGAGVVWFNISQSYIVNCTICSSSCTGSRSGGFYTSDNRLNCSYVGLFPGSKVVSPGRVLVNWSMGDGTYKIGNWSSDYNSTVVFGHYYSTPGTHVATAGLSYYA